MIIFSAEKNPFPGDKDIIKDNIGIATACIKSLGKAFPSLILSLLRQVLLFIPLVIILPKVFGLGLMGIWIAYPAADILSVILTTLFLRSELKKMSLSLW